LQAQWKAAQTAAAFQQPELQMTPILPRDSAPVSTAIMLLASTLLASGSALAAPLKTAVFPFEYVDLGQAMPGSAPPADEAARLKLIGGVLTDRLTASGAYALVPLEGTQAAIAKAPPLHDCPSCADDIARGAGAEIAVVGYVQKVSNLILNINIRVSDAQSGKVLSAASADIRGNTDESWTRGVEWLVKNRLLAKPQQP
jgi:hypothetical protein